MARSHAATPQVPKSRQSGAPFVEALDYALSFRYFPDPQPATVWTTYGVTDAQGLIRYVGCTTDTLPKRLYGHIATARRARPETATRWLTWLRKQLVQRLPVGIVSISLDTRRWQAIEKERTVISGLVAAGADLLNTQDIHGRRCLRCGLIGDLGTHVCPDSRAAVVSYRPEATER